MCGSASWAWSRSEEHTSELQSPCNIECRLLLTKKVNHALNIGIEHRFNETFSGFSRAASAFRTPNIHEIFGVGAFAFLFYTFERKIQTSHDVQGGFPTK